MPIASQQCHSVENQRGLESRPDLLEKKDLEIWKVAKLSFNKYYLKAKREKKVVESLHSQNVAHYLSVTLLLLLPS